MAPDDLEELRKILTRMLKENIQISARAVIRQDGCPYRHATDITRQPRRRSLLEEFKARQLEIRRLADATDKSSKPRLQLKIEQLQAEIAILKRDKEVLIGSHKAMLLAVAECGGMSAWKRLFPQWDSVLQSVSVIPVGEHWLHHPDSAAGLERAIRWASENPPSESDLDTIFNK